MRRRTKLTLAATLLSATITATVLYAVAHPDWLVNGPNMDRALRRLESKGIKIRSEATTLQTRPSGLTSIDITLQMEKPCIAVWSGTEGCFEHLSLHATVSIFGNVRIHNLEANHGKFTQIRAARADLNPLTWIQALKRLEKWEFNTVNVSINEWTVTTGESTTRQVIQIRNIAELPGLEVSHSMNDDSERKLSAIIRLQSEANLSKPYFSLESTRYQAQAQFQYRKIHIQAKAEGMTGPRLGQANAEFTIQNLGPRLQNVSSRNCKATLTKSSEEFHLEATCPTTVTTPTGKAVKGKTFEGTLRTDITLPLDAEHPIRGLAEISVNPRLGQAITGDIRLRLLAEGGATESLSHWRTETHFRTHFQVPDFQKLVQEMKATPYAIVAPLHVMQGKVVLDAEGEVDLTQGPGVAIPIPAVIKADLTSPTQRLLAESHTVLKIRNQRPHFSVSADVAFQDLLLELPKLDAELLPRFYMVKTIHEFHPKTDPRGDIFDFRFRLFSSPGGKSHVLTNLSEAPVPVSVDLTKIKNKPITGRLTFGKFPLRLFRHPVQVERFLLSFRFPFRDSLIDGAFRVQGDGYSILGVLTGTIYRPILKMTSNPVMPRSEMLSALLFSKRSEDLTNDQAHSVQQAGEAISDRALELPALYTLASAAIENVDYDRNIGAVNVRVRLTDGTMLKLSSEKGSLGRVGLEKRIGSNWVLSTDIGESSDGQGGSASALIEWINRY